MRFIKLLREPRPFSKASLRAGKRRLLTKICRRYKVDLLYLFGSAASKAMSPLSDVDFAYYSERSIPFSKELDLLGDLQDCCGREDIDLVNLKEADPLFAHNVVTGGILLFCRSEKLRTSVESRIQREYLDTIPLRNIQSMYLNRRIMNGTFGTEVI